MVLLGSLWFVWVHIVENSKVMQKFALTSNRNCPIIGDMKKLTLEEARKRFTDCGCVPLFDEYVNSRQKLPYIAGICGHHDECTMIVFLDKPHKGLCSKCSIELRNEKNKEHSIDTEDKFIELLVKIGMERYYIQGTFKGYNEKAEFICKGCGKHIEKIAKWAYHRFSRTGHLYCEECANRQMILNRAGPTRLKTVDEVAEMVNSKNKNFHLDKEAYSGSTKRKTKIDCDECGGFHMMRVSDIVQKNVQCPVSGQERAVKNSIRTKHKKFDDIETVLKWIETNLHVVVLDRIDNLTSYKKKISVKCLLCGMIRTSTLHLLYRMKHGCGCERKVAESISVDEFSKRFKDSIREYKIKIGKTTYRFDAFDPVAKVAFEFDGKQHFEVVEHWKTDLEQNRKNDRIKEKWCEENGIRLVRVDGRPFEHARRQEDELREAVRRAMDAAVPPVQMLLAI